MKRRKKEEFRSLLAGGLPTTSLLRRLKKYEILLLVGLYLLNVQLVAAFNIVTIAMRTQMEFVPDDPYQELGCPCIMADEDGGISKPCYLETSDPPCIEFAFDEEQAKNNNGDRCAEGTINCIMKAEQLGPQPRRKVPKQLLIRSRLLSFEESLIAQETGVATSSEREMSRYTSIGCFNAEIAGVSKMDNNEGAGADEGGSGRVFDPKACLDYCTLINEELSRRFVDEQAFIIVAVHKTHCGCVDSDMTKFTKLSDENCNVSCPEYQNQLCGGHPEEGSSAVPWNVFIEYENQSLGTAGTYDPWRYIWYTIVVIKEATVSTLDVGAGGEDVVLDAAHPERFYLHAVNEQGTPVFPNHLELEDFMLYGLQYDIDSSRLVGLALHKDVGRNVKLVPPLVNPLHFGVDVKYDIEATNYNWRYQIGVVVIDETNPYDVQLSLQIKEIQDQDAQPLTMKSFFANSPEQLVFTGVTSIVGRKDRDCYIFTQMDGLDATNRTDRFYVINIENGQMIFQQPLGFKALQVYANNRYGDVAIVGPKGPAESPYMMYIVLGRVSFSDLDKKVRWVSDYSILDPMPKNFLLDVRDFSFYSGLGTAGPKNSTFLAYRNYPTDSAVPRTRDNTAFSILQIDVFTGELKKWCHVEKCVDDGFEEDSEGNPPLHRSVDPEIPYAAVFNAEPGYPLTLPAPSIVSARFTMDGLKLQIVFDRRTTRGAKPEDTNGDRIPDQINTDTQHDTIFDCSEVMDENTVALIGTNDDGTACSWEDVQDKGETLVITLPASGAYSINVGMEVELKPDVIYSPPEDGEYSPASVSEGAVVQLPSPLQKPAIFISGNSIVDECSSVTLDASDTYRTGGSAEYTWELVEFFTENTVPKQMSEEAELALIERLETTDGAKLFIPNLLMPAGFTYRVKLSVRSRWGMSASVETTVKKLDYSAPTITIPRFEQPTFVVTSAEILLELVIDQSACDDTEAELSCEWSCTTGQMAALTEQFGGEARWREDNLRIPSFTLKPPTIASFESHDYIFQVTCVIAGAEGRVATAAAELKVKRSPVEARMFPESTMLGATDQLVLNARLSIDPDNALSYRCMLNPQKCGSWVFPGQYTFECEKELIKNGEPMSLQYCFRMDGSPELQPYTGDVCTKVEEQQVAIGYGFVITKVAFKDVDQYNDDDGADATRPYCYFFDGLLVVDTNYLALDPNYLYIDDDNYMNYIFTVRIEHQDGLRSDESQSTIKVTDRATIKVDLKPSKNKHLPNLPFYSAYHDIVWEGAVTVPDDVEMGTKYFRWEIWKQQSTSSSTSASGRAVKRYVNITSDFEWNDLNIMDWHETKKSSLTIHTTQEVGETIPTMSTDTTFKVTLWATMWPGDDFRELPAENYAEQTFTTASGRPTGGYFEAKPQTLMWPFQSEDPNVVFDANKWSANEGSSAGGAGDAQASALYYVFGYSLNGKTQWLSTMNAEGLGSTSSFHSEAPANGMIPYAKELIMLMKVCTLYLACTVNEFIINMEVKGELTYTDKKGALLGAEGEVLSGKRLKAAQITLEEICREKGGEWDGDCEDLLGEINNQALSVDIDPNMPESEKEALMDVFGDVAANLPKSGGTEAANLLLTNVEKATAGLESGATISPSMAAKSFGALAAVAGTQGTVRRRRQLRLLRELLTPEDLLQSIESTVQWYEYVAEEEKFDGEEEESGEAPSTNYFGDVSDSDSLIFDDPEIFGRMNRSPRTRRLLTSSRSDRTKRRRERMMGSSEKDEDNSLLETSSLLLEKNDVGVDNVGGGKSSPSNSETSPHISTSKLRKNISRRISQEYSRRLTHHELEQKLRVIRDLAAGKTPENGVNEMEQQLYSMLLNGKWKKNRNFARRNRNLRSRSSSGFSAIESVVGDKNAFNRDSPEISFGGSGDPSVDDTEEDDFDDDYGIRHRPVQKYKFTSGFDDPIHSVMARYRIPQYESISNTATRNDGPIGGSWSPSYFATKTYSSTAAKRSSSSWWSDFDRGIMRSRMMKRQFPPFAGKNHEKPSPPSIIISTYDKNKGNNSMFISNTFEECPHCGVYKNAFPKEEIMRRINSEIHKKVVTTTVTTMNSVVTEKIEDDVVPITEYDPTEVKYYHYDEESDTIYTLIYNRQTMRYNIINSKTRNIILESSRDSYFALEDVDSGHVGSFRDVILDDDNSDEKRKERLSPSQLVKKMKEENLVKKKTEKKKKTTAPLIFSRPWALTWRYIVPHDANMGVTSRIMSPIIHKCDESPMCEQISLICFYDNPNFSQVSNFGGFNHEPHITQYCCNVLNTDCDTLPCWHRDKCPDGYGPEYNWGFEFAKDGFGSGRQKRQRQLTVGNKRVRRLVGGKHNKHKLQQWNRASSSSTRPAEQMESSESTDGQQEGDAASSLRRLGDDSYSFPESSPTTPPVWTWFDTWMADSGFLTSRSVPAVLQREKTTAKLTQQQFDSIMRREHMSDSELLHARQAYSPSPIRRMQAGFDFGSDYRIDNSVAQMSRIYQLEIDEMPRLLNSQKAVKLKTSQEQDLLLTDAKMEIDISSNDPITAARLRAQRFQASLEIDQHKMDETRNITQILTRVAVLRDQIAKGLIRGMTANSVPMSFDTSLFVLHVGKVTNLSDVHPSFRFPLKYAVPADSPDEPTLTNPVTGFAFEYIEYKDNMYGFSDSTPPSDESLVVTLLIFKANAYELPVKLDAQEWISVFADMSLFSSGVCMRWDRFAPNTAGGAWSGSGIMNDGTGCIATDIGDLGVFVDGRVPDFVSLVEASMHDLSTYIDRPNIFTLATLGLVLLLNWFLIIYGYKADESTRVAAARGQIPPPSFHYDGDGVTTPLNANDPIAYKFSNIKATLFLMTFWNVIKREHLVVSPIFYHLTFTRPQRLLCVMALICGILAINAAVYGNPNTVSSGEQYVISGILSALLVYPVYSFLIFMFTGRPIRIKKRLIKRAQPRKELDMIARERAKLKAESMRLPVGDMQTMGLRAISSGPGPGGEQMSLLALPPATGAMPGQLALPMMPGDGMKPPAPRYPPPGGFSKPSPAPQEMLPPIYFQGGGFGSIPQHNALPAFDMLPPSGYGTPHGGPPQGRAPGPPMLGNIKAMTPRQESRGGRPTPPNQPIMYGSPSGGTPMGGGGRMPTPPPGAQGFGPPPGAPSTPPPAPPFGGGGEDREMGNFAPPPAFPGQHNMQNPTVLSSARDSEYSEYSDNDSSISQQGTTNGIIARDNNRNVRQDGSTPAFGSNDPGFGNNSGHRNVGNVARQNSSSSSKSYSSVVSPEVEHGIISGDGPRSPLLYKSNSIGSENSLNSARERESLGNDNPPAFPGEHNMMPPPPPGMMRGGNATPPAPPGMRGNATPPAPPGMRGNATPPNLDFTQNSGFYSNSGLSNLPPGARTPTIPTPSTRGLQTPSGMPPMIPFGMQGDNIIGRGQPPEFFKAPFRGPSMPGSEMVPWGVPMIPTGMSGGISGPGPAAGMPPRVSSGVPLPPPPPREDDSAFVRRVRLIYMDRVMREHQKQDLAEMEPVGKPIPNWVFWISELMPYISCASFVCASVWIIVTFSLKFDQWQQEHWYYACITGFVMVVFLLDVIRSAVITIVCLRKFEVAKMRNSSKGGDFQVKKADKKGAATLRAKPKTKAKATAPIPSIAPKFSEMVRPKFLPDIPTKAKSPPANMLRSGNTPPPIRSGNTPLGSHRGKTPPVNIPFGVSAKPGTPLSSMANELNQSMAGRTGMNMPPPPPKGPSPAGSFRGPPPVRPSPREEY